MPVANGLTTETKSKNNPDGTKIHCGVMLDAEMYKTFAALCDDKCLQKTAVLRRLIADFVTTQQFQSK